MYVITGATGHTGSVIADTLLAKGQKVRVIGRSKDRLERFVAKGAEAFVADVKDAAALTKAFDGARAVYAMVSTRSSPPKIFAAIRNASRIPLQPQSKNPALRTPFA